YLCGFLVSTLPRPPCSTLFPYTTLFRSGRPLMRMTFNWNPNDIRMTQYMKTKMEELAKTMNPDVMQSSFKKEGAQYDVRPYQTRSEEHTSELQSRENLVCRLLLEKKNNK